MSYVSVWRAAARALVELGCGAFFVGGVAWASIGSAAPWYVLAAVVFSFAVRAVDIEARALFVPGGLYGSVRDALGQRPAKLAVSALIVERLMLAPLAAVVAGHYAATLFPRWPGLFPADGRPATTARGDRRGTAGRCGGCSGRRVACRSAPLPPWAPRSLFCHRRRVGRGN